MSRYIDADALTAKIEELRCSICIADNADYHGVRCASCDYEDALTMIEEMPTEDVVEVIRCKDCKYKRLSSNRRLYCYVDVPMSKDDHYCYAGERRTDAETQENER